MDLPQPVRRAAARCAETRGGPVAGVLVAAVLVRAVLVPLGHGQDFVVWDKASTALLHGSNFYAHHPDYPGGPYAYFPLFADLEAVFRWLAWHVGVTFTVLGKVPIVVADLGCGALIAAELRTSGRSARVAALGAALFLFNPLVLYNSAYYGRFDSLGCALLLLAIRGLRDRTGVTRAEARATARTTARATARATAWWYALAVAAKTFPVLVLPGLVHGARGDRRRILVVLTAVLLALSGPYLGTPRAYLRDLVGYDAQKAPSGMSWQSLLVAPLGEHRATLISYLLLGVVALVAIALSGIVADLWWYTALVITVFLLGSKLVLEQYLTWPMPWLILIGLTGADRASRSSLVLLAGFTTLGMVDNESVHPLGRSAPAVTLTLAVLCLGYVVIGIRSQQRSHAGRAEPVRSLVGARLEDRGR